MLLISLHEHATELRQALQSTIEDLNTEGENEVVDHLQLDLQQSQQQDQYQKPAKDDEINIPTCDFDDGASGDDTDTEIRQAAEPQTGSMLPPYSASRRSSKAMLEDTSELVHHSHIALESSKFKLTLVCLQTILACLGLSTPLCLRFLTF